MIAETLSRMPRGAKIGAGVLVLPVALGLPFLVYWALAVLYGVSAWAAPVGRLGAALLGMASVFVYFAAVFTVPFVVGGLIGAAIEGMVGKGRGDGA